MWVPRWFKKVLKTLHAESSTIQEAIQEAIKKQDDAIRVYREASKNEQNEAARIIARAINDASNAASGYEKPQRNKEYWLQVSLVVLTALAAGGAITAAIGSWYALPQVKKSADAATKAACAARDAVNNSNQQFRMDQRPWIGVDTPLLPAQGFIPFVDLPGGHPTAVIPIEVRISNSGKSLARDVNLCVRTPEFLPLARKNPDCGCVKSEPKGDLVPGEPATLSRQDKNSATFLGVAVKGQMLITGWVRYTDVWNNYHTTHICFTYGQDTQKFTPCGFCGGAD